ncbi:MAG: HDIG domain-containing metalloprotein [Verrucomicrobiota bacterium]|nr:HDIG domain-containing metalloprotein [Verrucomicrobiota bacterium]
MFKALKRLQLKRRGLMTEKTRRKHSEKEWVEKLRDAALVRCALFLLFAIGLSALIMGAPDERLPMVETPWRATMLGIVILLIALLHFFINHPSSFRRNSRVFLIFGIMFIHLALLRLSFALAERGTFGDQGDHYSFLVAPFALAPMVISILLGRTQALFVTVLCSVWGTLLVGYVMALPIMVAGLVVGFLAVLVTDGVRKRSGLVRAGLLIGISVTGFGILFGMIGGDLLDGQTVDWVGLGYGVLAALLGGVVTAMVVGGVLPVLESLFRIITDISWIELADLNNPLLRRMTIEAPGSYHHSLLVANLAESAAEAIGANATMCRVCSYFHDIGKLAKPEYFIENIGEADNPHDDLTPTMSALVITAHVKEGVDIALTHKLNSRIIDVIEQHHGNSLVYFFYRKAIEQEKKARERQEEGELNDDDIPEVSEESFRYPGPKPQFKESGIISLADAVESASRSLEKPTPGKITQLVEDIVSSRILDGQLSECDLTLREISVISESFNSTLRSMLHSRITYPKDTKDTERNGAGKNAASGKNGSNGQKSPRNGIQSGKAKKEDVSLS